MAVLNTEAIVEVDLTAVDALEAVRAELESRGVVMALARLKQDLRAQLAPSVLLDHIGEDLIFPTPTDGGGRLPRSPRRVGTLSGPA